MYLLYHVLVLTMTTRMLRIGLPIPNLLWVWAYGSLRRIRTTEYHGCPLRRLLHTLAVGGWVYALAFTEVSLGRSLVNTVYAGCADGVIRCWNMSELNTGKVR